MTTDSPGGFSDRRTFIKTVGAVAAALSASGFQALAQSSPSAVRFGLDMYSVNQHNWTPFQQLHFAEKWKIKVVHFSEIRFLGTLDPDNLKRVRARADELNIDLEIGMRSICPSSKMFDKAQGTSEEQLGTMIDAAKNRRRIRPCGRPSGRSPTLRRASSGRRDFSETVNADC